MVPTALRITGGGAAISMVSEIVVFACFYGKTEDSQDLQRVGYIDRQMQKFRLRRIHIRALHSRGVIEYPKGQSTDDTFI